MALGEVGLGYIKTVEYGLGSKPVISSPLVSALVLSLGSSWASALTPVDDMRVHDSSLKEVIASYIIRGNGRSWVYETGLCRVVRA